MSGRTLHALLFLAGALGLCPPARGAESSADASWEQAMQRGKQLWMQGNLTEAEAVLEGVLRQANVSGRDDPRVAMTLNGLGSVYQDMGRYGEAEQSYRSAVLALEKTHGKDDPTLASALHNLADLYMETGQYEKAEPLLRQSLSIRTAALGPDDPDVAMTLNNLGALYNILQEDDRAPTTQTVKEVGTLRSQLDTLLAQWRQLKTRM